MGLETSIVTVLTDDATVAALVDDRVRPEVGYPEEDDAQITYTYTDEPVYHSTGVAALRYSRISLTCWGRTKESADLVFDAVKSELEGSDCPKTFGDVYLQTLRRTNADARASAISETSENTPDWWVRSMEYFAAWQ